MDRVPATTSKEKPLLGQTGRDFLFLHLLICTFFDFSEIVTYPYIMDALNFGISYLNQEDQNKTHKSIGTALRACTKLRNTDYDIVKNN